MKPTQEQKLWLQDYLSKVMNYRETCDEVYDHMLLAILDEPEHEFFETTVTNIISRDFGTNNGLYDMEENCTRAAKFNAVAQYRNDIKRWFTSSQFIVTVAMFALLFYLQFPSVKTKGVLLILFLLLLIFPTVLSSIRSFRSGYKYGGSMPSIKDEIFRRITFRSNSILWCILLLCQLNDFITKQVFKLGYWPSEKTIPITVVYFVMTSVLVLMIIHVSAAIKLHTREFKAGMIAK